MSKPEYYKRALILVLIISVKNLTFAASSLAPVKLTCEYIANPLAIDSKKPRFAWQLESKERNQSQSGYELIVSDNMNDIQKSVGNLWQSGKVNSSQSVQVEYAGSKLKSFTKYYWRIKVYDKNGEASVWSVINSFETAIAGPIKSNFPFIARLRTISTVNSRLISFVPS